MRVAKLIGGITCLLAGVCLVGAYLWQAVIQRWGLPDQSLLFWLAIFPILGIQLGVVGVRLINRSRRAPGLSA